MCGYNLKLEPMSGELEPNSHQNIKMTLIPARFPTHFEGEIQCSIDWLNEGEEKAEMKSMKTSIVVNDQEFLFLRLKKRTKFVSYILYFRIYLLFCKIDQGLQPN